MAYHKTQSGLLVPHSIPVNVRRVRAKYDAAQTTSDNSRHWANADALSADAAISPAVRRILRMRARYEVANNSYLKGMVLTLANDLVGTGPRLQVITKNKELNTEIEKKFADWQRIIKLAKKLRVMRMAKVIDGETFGIFAQNKGLKTPVQFDIKLYEADQIASPSMSLNLNDVDGIEYDEFGNPSIYYLLKNHPGSMSSGGSFEADKMAAEHVMHWFRIDRPGQSRGVTELAPMLPLGAEMRRYTQAVIAAAETAADFAAVLQTNTTPDEAGTIVTPMDVIELEKRMVTVMPEGYQLGQVKAEQPTTTYAEFKRQILGECGRCLNMPINVTLGDSSDYNYASGRLDYQVYRKSTSIEQSDVEEAVLDRIFERWLNEAILVSDNRTGKPYLPIQARNTEMIDWQWMWDGNEHVDPQKEANAQDIRLKNGSTNLAHEYSRTGKDWEAETQRWVDEIQFIAKGLGITPAEYLKLTSQKPQPTSNVKDDEDEN